MNVIPETVTQVIVVDHKASIMSIPDEVILETDTQVIVVIIKLQ